MIKEHRHKRILSILHADGVLEIGALARVMPEVSRVTLRRDIAELADAGALKRTHGGAVLPDATVLKYPGPGAQPSSFVALDGLDGVILPPIQGRGGDAFRRQILRHQLPFLAESAAQPGGIYLGPDNHAAAFELGALAGAALGARPAVTVLIVGHTELPNTRERADGFEAGLRSSFAGALRVVTVNGQGSYKPALRVALDAFATADRIDLVFGVNDHSAIAGMEAGERCGAEVAVYAVGGEHADFVARVAEGGPIKAVAAFFPEVVGDRGVDVLAAALGGAGLPEAAITPHAIVTPETLRDHFEPVARGWQLRADRRAALAGPPPEGRRLTGRRIGFMPHFPAHDWYRSMITAMQARAAHHGLELVVTPPHQGIATEISRLRREIAAAAAAGVRDGETVLLGEGEATLYLAEELRRRVFEDPAALAGTTVITNALDILYRLEDAPGIKTILTSGEYQAPDRCLVGPSLGALFERMRADCAYLAVSGVSPRFGVSAMDERLALAGSRFVEAGRRVVALADHTLIGADANHRIARIDAIDTVITDDGAVAADRQALRAAGVEVLVAGEGADDPASQIPQAERRDAQ